MKPTLLAALVFALASVAPAAGAQTPIPLMTVDAVNVSPTGIAVTGIVQGDSQPSTRSYSFNTYSTEAQKAAALDRCHRSLLLALAKPGQYLARIGLDTCVVALVAP